MPPSYGIYPTNVSLSLLPLCAWSFTSTPGTGHGTVVGLVSSLHRVDVGRFLLRSHHLLYMHTRIGRDTVR
ncbi:hypothetical protein V8D89_013433 [Ganoderma adspersum]